MVSLNWTKLALNDLSDIFDFIADDSIKYAQITVNKIVLHAQTAQIHPRVGRMVPEIGNPDIREIIVGHYRIIFRIVTSDKIDIVRIYHSARKLTKNKI